MTLQRRFEPEAEALDRVVEILYRLLVECPESRPAEAAGVAEQNIGSPCLLTTHE
jgi:hypothetical protein